MLFVYVHYKSLALKEFSIPMFRFLWFCNNLKLGGRQMAVQVPSFCCFKL